MSVTLAPRARMELNAADPRPALFYAASLVGTNTPEALKRLNDRMKKEKVDKTVVMFFITLVSFYFFFSLWSVWLAMAEALKPEVQPEFDPGAPQGHGAANPA